MFRVHCAAQFPFRCSTAALRAKCLRKSASRALKSPECVLLSPEEYLRLIDEVNDAKLAALAAQRMQHFDADKAIPAEEVYQKYGISDADLADFDEVEFE